MTTLGNLKTQMRELSSRGTSLDGELDNYFRQAHKYIERRYSFLYMFHFDEFQLDPESKYPRTIKLDLKDLKSLSLVRLIDSLGQYHDVEQIDAKDSKELKTGIPEHFWLVQRNLLIFDAVPAEKYPVELGWYEYSVVGTDNSWTSWLFQNFEDGVLYNAMTRLAIRLKDKSMIAEYTALFDDAFSTLIMAEEEADRLTSSPTMGGY